ncbi:CCA tRNA nucleotidyltransferase [Rhizobium straminoryzae]|uniref:CCA tRNA nucleotidyltransferase n=1 Tax=Rhizobium straminoryzae TaxID=1387186 RepID=A0A549TDK9_9HYPH|nr:CCA tRNA nucleotidyltransferase [Rhizobium straminoryzae]TRL40122.1 CCA tRNA nucleotidyltransferase [Rhizobium straminoryzae]
MTSLAGQNWLTDPVTQRVFALLNAEGGEGRIVGGAVRNALMGHPISDLDFATTNLPQVVIARAKTAGIKAVPTGIDHGTVTLVVEGRPFEVTTLRRDVETDGRRATVAFGTDWQVDADRRDFTINALYVTADGTVIDLVDGLPDIESRSLRFIGNAEARIAEDYLRVLRFFRFFAWYGSGRPDAEGLKAAARARDRLATLSAERIWAEMKKLLSAPDPSRALLWMRTSGVLGAVLPESEKWGIDAVHGLVATEQGLGWTPDPLLRLAAIVPPDVERLAMLARRWRLSNAEAEQLAQWARVPEPSADLAHTALDRMLYRDGKSGMMMRLRLSLASARRAAEGSPEAMAKAARLSALLARAEAFARPVFPLTGGDVMALGISAGPRVGQLLHDLEAFWLERNFAPDKAALTARLKDLADKPAD